VGAALSKQRVFRARGRSQKWDRLFGFQNQNQNSNLVSKIENQNQNRLFTYMGVSVPGGQLAER
jgi:hypothetical protein